MIPDKSHNRRQRPDDRAIYADVLKVAAECSPRIPVPHDLSDQQSDLAAPLKKFVLRDVRCPRRSVFG
jgi:hypothetical protein